MVDWQQAAEDWAHDADIAFERPGDNSAWASDYGRVFHERPAFVWKPSTVDQLQAIVRYLADRELPLVVRGTGHASGGQSLHEHGNVLSITALNAVKTIEHDGAVWCQAGATWRAVNALLQHYDRQPYVLTGNQDSTVGGTLAVGGLGAGTSVHGLQIDHVAAVRVVTADGTLHEAVPGDELFDFVLAGRGQVAILVEAKIATFESDWTLRACALKWSNWDTFEADARKLIAMEGLDYFGTRLLWGPGRRFRGAVGGFHAGVEKTLETLSGQLEGEVREVERIDFAHLIGERAEDPGRAVPALEFSIPWPESRDWFERLLQALEDAGISGLQPEGSPVCFWPSSRSTLPLAPFRSSQDQLFIALRPAVYAAATSEWLERFERYARDIVEHGGRLYAMSYGTRELDSVVQALGVSGQRWREMKHTYDPGVLLNPPSC